MPQSIAQTIRRTLIAPAWLTETSATWAISLQNE
jgi:hypothetical protein